MDPTVPTGNYSYDPNDMGQLSQQAMGQPNHGLHQQPGQQLPGFLQQQNIPGPTGAVNDMIRALLAGAHNYQQHNPVQQATAPTNLNPPPQPQPPTSAGMLNSSPPPSPFGAGSANQIY